MQPSTLMFWTDVFVRSWNSRKVSADNQGIEDEHLGVEIDNSTREASNLVWYE